MPLIAHVGHWSMWILYGIPILIVLGSIVLQMVRDRQADDAALDPGDRGRDVDEGEAGERERDA